MDFANLITGLLIISLVHGQKYAGDSCYHKRHSKNGICKAIGECPSAIKELTTQQLLPETCSYDGTAPIVCCPVDAPPPTPSTTTTTTTSTTTTTEAPPEIVEKSPVGVGAKSYQKCKEYAEYVYITREKPTLSGSSKNITDNVCGFKHVKLIVGGVKAKGREFPHMALIGYDTPENEKAYVCGGSLISKNYVLTAGHCISPRGYGLAKYVRVGELVLGDDNDDADPQELNVIERISHPDYRPPSQYNDIALLKVEKDFDLTAYVRPICLNYEKNLPNDDKAMATGWGTTRYLGSTSAHLLKVTLDFFSYDECKLSYEENRRKLARGIEDDTQTCAGSKTEEKDTCQGDSGGPLQVYHDNVYCMYKLVGVTSFGKACGLARTPGIYSRVSYYLPWIEKTVWP